MAILSHLLHITNFKSPLLRTVVPCVGAAVAIQAAAALPSVLAQTERFFDISGSLTFVAVGALSLCLPQLRGRAATATGILGGGGGGGGGGAWNWNWNWRQVAVTAMAVAWATRLGYYLFDRITKDGHDPRFEKLRTQPARFAGSFVLQALWVSLMLLPVMAVNAVPATAWAALPRLLLTDVLGLASWTGGLALEAAADAQKSRWVQAKREKKHDEPFLATGLFARCRFPHYFGEISLWSGLATLAAGLLARTPVQAALGLSGLAGQMTTTAVSFTAPAFSAFLLTKVSGIPLTEARHDERFKDNKQYWEWKRNTPQLVPKLW